MPEWEQSLSKRDHFKRNRTAALADGGSFARHSFRHIVEN